MRVMITGGAGFLGSHLCEHLLDAGHDVICVDNFMTGSKRNLRGFKMYADREVEVIRHDITFPLYVEVDAIYNLACPASPVWYQKDPVQTLKTAVHGSINMLGLAKRLKIPILQASTSEIYGNPAVHPQTEDYWGNVNPTGPRACYDEGKRCAETLFMDYHRQHGVDIRIARIFNTYGRRMSGDDGRVISNFFQQALDDVDITINGDGSQTRSFCYVTDMVDGLVSLMESDINEPVNLGNPQETTILDLAGTIKKITESASKLVFRDLPVDDPLRRKPDISLAKEKLGWEPKVELEAGLKDMFRRKDANVFL